MHRICCICMHPPALRPSRPSSLATALAKQILAARAGGLRVATHIANRDNPRAE